MTEPGQPSQPPEHEHAMTAHAPAPGLASPLFPADEWAFFRKADWTAAAYIVGLMASIFCVGLVLYLIVLWSVLA